MDVRRSERANKYTAAPVVEIGDSESESDASEAPGASRPKLRTRKAVEYASSEHDTVADEDGDGDGSESAEDMDVDSAAVTAKKRKRTQLDEEEEEEYEPQTESQMMEDDEADEGEDDESVSETDTASRRRSSRARKTPIAFAGLDDDYEDSRLDYISKPRRERSSTSRKAPPKTAAKTSSKRKSKKKSKGSKSSSESDSDDEFLMSESEQAAVRGGRDSDDENVFVIDKIIAREVHTLKEWSKICANKNTRFLQNMSIFLEDDDDEVDDAEEVKPLVAAPVSAADEKKVENDANGEDAVTGDATVAVSADADLTAGTNGVDAVMEDTSSAAKPAELTTPSTPRAKSSIAGKSASTPINLNEVSQTQERFLVKWKGLSHLHVSWENEKSLLEVDKNAKGKIQRFRDKELMGLFSGSMYGDEYFSPEFRIVDRILDIQDRPGDDFLPIEDDEETAKIDSKWRYFYVKWKSRPYDEVTWEREDDVNDDAAVKVYEDRLMRAAARHNRPISPSRKKNRKIKFRGYSASNAPPFREGNPFELRDYQLTGVNWMLFNWYQNRNSLLADEMGLGKTVQTVTYINHLAVVEELSGPYLIIAPLSTLGHWQREFMNWTYLDAIVYHGSANSRKKLQEYEFFLNDQEYARAEELRAKSDPLYRASKSTAASRGKRDNYRFDVLITTPEMCATPDFSKLTRVNWQVLVVDEAHRLKNKSSKLSSLIHKNFKYENILLLTGTPLQNNVEELWTLLNFLDKERFESMESFLERFGDLKDMTQVEQLHAELKPFLLRRMKEDVEKSLAPKEETIVEVELTVLQKQYYRAIYEMNTEFLARGRKKAQTPSLMNVAMELRKCCNHPFLIKGVEEQEIIRIQQQKNQAQEDIARQIQEILVTSSGKLVLLDKLLPRLKENGHRVLIFSQFKIMLDILQDYLRLRSYHCERIDGNITGNDRQAAIDRYCDPNSLSFIMLLSTRAGGVGINLTAADTVIIYDSDWNPQNDLQAQARCHRIGQKKSVKIYRLLTSKTYELHMFHQASLKLGLDQAVLGGIRSKEASGLITAKGKGKLNASGPSKEEIEHLLKHGAYEIFKEEKDGDAEAASKRFSEESIDQILNRSTKIIHDPKADSGDGKKSLMSSFSKATFVSSSNPDEQVALDDPDFWTKVIGLQEVEEKPVDPSPLKKRRRRPVKSYLLDDSDNENTSKRLSKKPKALQEKDNEEYVISDDSEDSDDDDDEDMDDDDFAGGLAAKKKDKKVKSSVPPLSMYTERIAELLASYGYGRWDDMIKNYNALKFYTVDELKTYAQQYIAHCVHVASGTSLANNTPLSNGEMPEPLSSATKTNMIDQFAVRFRFLQPMLKEMNVAQLSHVTLPKNLRMKPTSVKAQRDANARLQQIERMYFVQKIIRSKIGAPSPMVTLINDLQQLDDRDQIRDILRSGILPESFALNAKRNTADSEASLSGADTSAPEASADTSGEKADAPPAVSEPIAVTTVTEDATEANAADGDMDVAVVAPAAADVKSDVAGKSDDAIKTDDAAMNSDESGVKSGQLDAKEADFAAASEEKFASTADGQKEDKASTPPSAAPAESKAVAAESKQVPTVDAPAAGAGSAPPPTAPDAPAPAPSSAADAEKDQRERMEALRRLQELPDVGFPSHVSPWWISVLDDVILLFYVYKDGWFKGRTLPNQLVTQSSLFGSRASKYDMALWPSVATLTKRVKSVIAAWTNERKLRQQARTAPAPASTSKYHWNAASTHSAHGSSAHHSSGRGVASAAHSSSTQPRTMYSSSRHNRFAKIVFAFGIPDTRTCRDDPERLEKWRYFIQDAHLDVAGQPMVELLAEALDLERCCRLRVSTTGGTIDPSVSSQDALLSTPSILGGIRGQWFLTLTQCRRLLQRVDLFRLLRTQILVLPPNQLVDVVGRVVTSLRADPSKNEFPRWWSSPRHDILLLQGVECYGLDEYLTHVWKLPLFAHANPSGSFPNTTWVENYVTALSLRCRRAMNASGLGTLSKRATAAAVAAVPPAAERVRDPSPPKRESSEVRQRIRDIQGMRSEDPYFTPTARLRQLIESNAAADWKTSESQAVGSEAATAPASSPPPPARPATTDEEEKAQQGSEQREDDDFERAVPAAARKKDAAPQPSSSAAAAAAKQKDPEVFASPRGRQQSIQEGRKEQTRTFTRPVRQTRSRAPRTWDVIVIDESDDEDED